MNPRELSWPRRILVATLGHPVQTAGFVYVVWQYRPDRWLLQIAFWLGAVGVLVAADTLGYYWLHNPYAERLKARTAAEQPVSAARLAYLAGSVLVMFAAWALVVAVMFAIGPHPSRVGYPALTP